MVKNIVLLTWNEGVSQQQIDAVTVGFCALSDEIPEIVSYTFGPDAGISIGNADYALVAEFRNESDLKAYVVRRSHQAFPKDIASPILASFSSAQFDMAD